jgi:hypothetical protein
MKTIVYWIVAIVLIAITALLFANKFKAYRLKRKGLRVPGIIIENYDTYEGDNMGIINDPVVRFTTLDGKDIVGRPLLGFVTRNELTLPSNIFVIYDPKDPKSFCLDI